MATRAVFQTYSAEQIDGVLQHAKQAARRAIHQDYTMALDFLEGRQMEHTQSAIDIRYTRTQDGGAGQRIEAVTMPIVQRYVAESATAYNHGVKRKLVTLEGESNEQTEAMTDELNKQLGLIGYDEKLHRLEQLQRLLGDVGLWFQVKAGKLRPVIVLPQDIYPVAPPADSAYFMDPTDQADYLGYIVQILADVSDSGQFNLESSFAFISHAETAYYMAQPHDPYSRTSPVTRFPNPFKWTQLLDTPDQRGAESMLPLQMLTLWHSRVPVDGVLSFPDADIVTANLELNVQWSLLLDTMRIQGWDTTVMNVLNPNEPQAQRIPHGSRFPIVLESTETVTKLAGSTPYQAIVDALRSFIKALAVSHRQSPNDFAIEGAAPQSGFAKIIDSLPKIEARQEHVRRLKMTEEILAWPRIASIGAYLGWEGFNDSTVKNVKMTVEFDDLKFPKTIDEDIRKWEFALKHKMTTPAEILAQWKDIDVAEAEERIAANKEASGPDPESQPPQPPQQQGPGAALGALIAQRRAPQQQRSRDDEDRNT